jgi:hypothetical protein
MATTPQRPAGTTGVIRIVRQAHEGDRVRPFDYLISFGGRNASEGAVHLGKACGTEDLIHLLTRTGVSGAEAEMAVRALADQPEYEISGVTPPAGIASSRDHVRRSSVEAPHNANTAGGHEPPLYLEVRRRLEQGTLPPAPIQVQVGRAIREHICVVCQRLIRPGQVQNEFRADDGARASVHTLCLRAWVDVSRAPKAP